MFNVDPKLDAQGVAAHFSIYGDVKRVQSIPEKENHRLVEFYDLRHAHAAMEALNKTDALKLKSSGLSTGLKQTMSLQQLARGSIDSEQVRSQSLYHPDASAGRRSIFKKLGWICSGSATNGCIDADE